MNKSYIFTVEDEVAQCFRENTELSQKSLREIALFFFLQGQMRHVDITDALKAKVEHYRKYFEFEELKKIDAKWEEGIK